jgi:hypothetical protein
MLVFIDESGDAGLKIASGSSQYFIVTLVGFRDSEEAQKADEKIDLLRKECGFPDNFEFHFNKLACKHRERFLRGIAAHRFFYLSIVINKRNLTGKGFQYKESFYKYTCKLVFENAKQYLQDAIVVIDGSGSREFRQQLATYLKKCINEKDSDCRNIKKVKMQDSKNNNLLQLADMVCGAVARSYGSKTDARLFRGIIRHREIYVQFWPK